MLADLFYHLSAQTRYLRYFLPLPLSLANAWAEGHRMARRPAAHGQTLIATVQPAGITEAVGVAELVYDAQATMRGELAVLVRDDQQGRGIGTALVCELMTKARAQGIDELHADLLPENRAALRLLRRLQLPMDTSINAGGIHVTMRLL